MSTTPAGAPAGPRTIRGAVLERIGAERPYADSTPLRVQELTLDPPGPGELLVRIEAAGLCHSDLSVVDGNRVRPVPMLLGHESAGTVEAVGAGVTDLAPGDRVVMVFLPRCGECAECATDGRLPCSRGSAANTAGELLGGGRRLHRDAGAGGTEDVHHHLGVSGFATHAVVDRRSVVPIGADVPAGVAAVLGCAVLTGGGAVINAARPGPADDIVVVGLGGVGMAALLVARALTTGTVTAVDQQEPKLQLARELGADRALTPQQAEDEGVRAPAVVEAAGHPRAFETAVRLTAPGGTTVTVGLPAPDALARISPLVLTAEARTIVGSYLGSAVPSRDIPRFEQLWRDGRLPLERLISGTIGLEEVNEGMDRLADGLAVRQVIEF
ncbi:alcohol dehydrogenase [Citricoccus sp. SGAir0253]|uniref:alcohol dehydrogenase catalytic domain-containing protein n=1 Tax=Citricoccus sp. SGAir0253 TaxID=2567881 RepID=UPI0010CD5FFF|nr:alcohol dehydrogenase catalytic domain-containing protein [Citricoccus sp. SGAir0253]QCU79022.1 alcohol dehydrogenase [Citricoccus sp. SGAir0253]